MMSNNNKLYHEHKQTEEIETIGPPGEPKSMKFGYKKNTDERSEREQSRRVHAAMQCNAVQWSSNDGSIQRCRTSYGVRCTKTKLEPVDACLNLLQITDPSLRHFACIICLLRFFYRLFHQHLNLKSQIKSTT